ncbi:hypothetical protein GGR57DRAFT_508349 [Xylariaceae sp. FL1272]|nr:hypothetical protein GGR57DRAFT_508349 [Xylariaceae sp. FL1272]
MSQTNNDGSNSKTPLTGDNRVPLRERISRLLPCSSGQRPQTKDNDNSRLHKALVAQAGNQLHPLILVDPLSGSEPAEDSHLVPHQTPGRLTPGMTTPQDAFFGKASLPPSPRTPTTEAEEPECPGAPKKGKIPQLKRHDDADPEVLERMVNEPAASDVSQARPAMVVSSSSGRRTSPTRLRQTWGPGDANKWNDDSSEEEDINFREYCAELKRGRPSGQ